MHGGHDKTRSSPNWSRRNFVKAGLAFAAMRADSGRADSGDEPLKAAAEAKGLRFGASASVKSLKDPAFVALLLRECDTTAAVNEFKWPSMNPLGPDTDYSAPDFFVDWAHSHGLRQRGHTLVWDKPGNVPRWVLQGPMSAASLGDLIAERATALCSRYRGRVQSWDVVNEAIEPGHGVPVAGPLYKVLGWDFARIAFEAAHEADAHAQLTYNDLVVPGADKHQDGILRLLERLLAQGAPVHALGVEGHLWIPTSRSGDAGWRRFLAEVADMGLEILVTELDVIDNGPQGNLGWRNAVAADRVRRFLDVTLQEPAVREVVCRSLSDKYEGLSYILPRSDKLKRAPSPFDTKMAPKPMMQAIRAAFDAAPARG